MDDIYFNFQSPPDEDTLSLRDFPVTPQTILQVQPRTSSSSSPQPSEIFEFFTDFANSEKIMSHAEDIIFCGKLMPFKQNYQQHEEKHHFPIKQSNLYHRRRSESMSELKSINKLEPLVMRTSRSLDDNKYSFDRTKDSESSIHRTNSGKFKVPKSPRWLVFMIGGFKLPSPEMDLRDIKSRQVRRSGSTALFPSVADRDMMSANRSDRKSSSWTILDVLGCQGSASVAVRTPLSC